MVLTVKVFSSRIFDRDDANQAAKGGVLGDVCLGGGGHMQRAGGARTTRRVSDKALRAAQSSSGLKEVQETQENGLSVEEVSDYNRACRDERAQLHAGRLAFRKQRRC